MSRRRAWLTREGWYYSAVLAFIVGGAVLRSVNLLVVLAGMMIATLLINWRLIMASLTGLSIRRRLPQQMIAGEPLVVEVAVENSRWWMSGWLLTVEDWVQRVQDADLGPARKQPDRKTVTVWWPAAWLRPRRVRCGEATHARAVIPHVPARGRTLGTYRITIHRRGTYRFGPLRVSTSFPLGLVRGRIIVPDHSELVVAPRLGRLLPNWANLLEAEIVGDHRRHPERGISDGDYYGLRPWQSGDSLRWIHWRTTAKLGRPVVRLYERRRSRDTALVLDPWLPAHPTEPDLERVELAVSLAATAVADLISRGQSRLTFGIALQSPECFTGPASSLFCQELLGRLAQVSACRQTAILDAVRCALDEAVPGSRLIVISTRPPDDPSLAASSAELAMDPQNMLWIDSGSEQLGMLFSYGSD